MFRTFFVNIIGLCGHRNKRKSVLEKLNIFLFLYSNTKISEQEMSKMAIHTHDIFRPGNAMFSLLNIYEFYVVYTETFSSSWCDNMGFDV